MRATLLALALLVAAAGAEAASAGRARASPIPFLPSASEAIGLVRQHTTYGFVTVAQTLAYAARARPDSFRMERIRTEQRAGEPFTRVHLCYWLRNPGARVQATCGIEFLVSVNPSHVVLAQPLDGLSRDLQAGREQFVRAIDHELALQRAPAEKALSDAFARLDPYDWR
ncbi:hypothetical protein [Methylobacterium nigriterrae]|uniref:hypothetical protein n=1 Tax=Methylobacterium nigriterrae TaxID=3127512 RepID=UPI0030135EC1